MKDLINKLLEDIKIKKEQIKKDYEKLNKLFSEKYKFTISDKKIFFDEERVKNLRQYKKSILESIFSVRVREILSIPFIYSMIIPAIILDIFLFIYQ